MSLTPQRRPGLVLQPADDAFLVTSNDSDAITWINRTAAIIFELCNGKNDPRAIASALAAAFELPWIPEPDVLRTIDQLVTAGLVSVTEPVFFESPNSEANVLLAVWNPHEVTQTGVFTRIESFRERARKEGIRTSVAFSSETSMRLARNGAAASVIESNTFSHVLFLDATLDACEPLGTVSLRRLIDSQHSVIGLPVQIGDTVWQRVQQLAVAHPNSDPQSFAAIARGFNVGFGGLLGKKRIQDGFLEARSVGSQALLVSRFALQRLAGSHAAPLTRGEATVSHVFRIQCWGFFDPVMSVDRLSIGEDLAFCERWRSLGEHVMIDTQGLFGKSLIAVSKMRQTQRK